MPIPIEAYTVGGVVSGVVARAGTLRELLEAGPLIEVERATFATIERPDRATPQGSVTLEPDEILLALFDEGAAGLPIHAQWHALRVVLGPWAVDGELPTMPGFDPGRALARPSGTFVLLRDARVTRLADEALVADHHAVLVHRYEVERVDADLELGFFFPGAEVDVDVGRSGASLPA